MRAGLALLAIAVLACASPAAARPAPHHKPVAKVHAKAPAKGKAKATTKAKSGAKTKAEAKAKPETRSEPRAKVEEPVDDGGLGRLFHAAPEAVRARLGDPDVARAEGKGAFWTYRLPHCALFLFFHEGAKGLRVSGASTGPRKRGEPILDVKACLASAVQGPDDAT